MANPGDPPGWQPDPEKPGMLRWWNGLGWSDAHRRADATMERIRSEVQGAARSSTITPQQVARTTAAPQPLRPAQVATTVAGAAVRGANPFAAGAITLGVLGLLFGFYGVLPIIGLIVALAGIVRSRRLAQQGTKRTGLGRSLAGLILSGLSLASSLPSIIKLFTDLAQSAANS